MKTDEILEAIIKCCKNHGAGQVILFGSRAKGTCLDTSDVDIGVSCAVDVEGLREELEELPTLYNELLLEDIREYGCKIYEKI